MNTTVMIRLATPKDAAEMLKIYAHYVVNTAISFEYEVPSEEEFRERIESTLKRYPYIVAEQEGHIIGYRVQTPRFCGLFFSAGLLLLSCVRVRGLRTS